jgi:co-chaperonin GroES (HSP10)
LLGQVVSLGPLVNGDALKQGDVVAFNSFRGSELEHEGDTLLMLREEEVLGVFETEAAP